jgi:acyl dehydratase
VYVHSPGRTVSEADNILFSTLTMATQSLHLDAEWAKRTEFGERLINSMFTLSALVGTSVAQLTQGTVVANLGITEVRFPNPMRAGHTRRSETRPISERLSRSRAGQEIVELEHIARNQRGQILVIATRATLVLCSPIHP